MSVTTVLVPVLGPEAEALFEGHRPPAIMARAATLRRRVGRIDTIREDLHALLFEQWKEAVELSRAAQPRGLRKLWAKPPPPRIPSGYDPYVHIFGRSLPVVGESSKVVVEGLSHLLQVDDTTFDQRVATDLRTLSERAPELFEKASTPDVLELEGQIAQQFERLTVALSATPIQLRNAYDACVALSAWSWPVWRLDGVMLGELSRLVGVTTPPGAPTSLFEELQDSRPEIEAQLPTLPKGLQSFAGAGAYWSSTDVKMVAGALRLSRSKVARNAVENGDDAESTLRQLRILEEAVLFCEAENLGLAEAAGVEWHDRARLGP